VAKDTEPSDKKEEASKNDGGLGEGEETKAEGEGEEGLHPPKKKISKKTLLIIAGAAFVLLVGGGAALFFSGSSADGTAAKEETHADGESASQEGGADSEEEEAENKGHGEVAFFSLGDVLVNLSGDGKRPNFLKIKVDLELADKKDITALDAMKPRIIDQFQVYLRELRVEDLRGSAGLYRLREELLLRVTEVVKPIRVRNVLFQEMLVQ